VSGHEVEGSESKENYITVNTYIQFFFFFLLGLKLSPLKPQGYPRSSCNAFHSLDLEIGLNIYLFFSPILSFVFLPVGV
jgi:hypothetical protein